MSPVINASASVDTSAPRVKRVGMTLTGQAQYTSVQSAITAAAAMVPAPDASNPAVVEVYPGVYNEAITMAAFVNLKGIGPVGSVVIYQTDATIVTLANPCQIENVTVRLTTPSATRNIIIDNGVACVTLFDKIVIEVTTPGAFVTRNWYITGSSTITIKGCSYDISGINSTGIYHSAGAATIKIFDCDFNYTIASDTHIREDSAGASTIYSSGNRYSGACALINSSKQTTKFSNDNITCTGGTNISGTAIVTVKSRPQQYEVYAGMLIQHAITAAAADTPTPSATAPYTILIHPGIYTEVITCSTYVNLKGVGPKGSVVIQQTDATIITLATQVQIENLTVTLVTPSASRNLIIDNGVACVCRFIDIIVNITTPGASTMQLWLFTASSTVVFEKCSYAVGSGAGSDCRGIRANAASDIRIVGCNFRILSPGGIHLYNASTGIIVSEGNLYDGTCAFVASTGAGSIKSSNDAILCTDVSMITSGIVRFNTCQYRANTIRRSSTGNIVDESPQPASYGFHTIKKYWEPLTVATMNIAARLALAGSATIGGNGQCVLRINDNVLDAAGVESAADAAGGLASTFDCAKTPRYVQQVSFGALRATSTMFFGLRATPGAAVPTSAEVHAGFIWDGTNLKTSNSPGTGGGNIVATNLAAPSIGAQHQLEVIVLGGKQVEFYVDGVLVVTATTQLPTGAVKFQEYEISGGGGGATTSDVTLREGFIQECPA